ncbi:Zinc metalloprotease (EC 3.4.24.-) [Mycetohabitans rhizoxinica HKI 454]|uniref:Zinc metalloprotease n=1 Tax=Mycetohabitans rhizoxinica (strain DSM 19002 / CIP 109453 / HKI 454) TaxID=882378 RepID=E5ANT1_MYCRK|nr:MULTISPECIES: M48 family metallopeptidase [Mycetohabitans]MCF7695122.1 M48 family metallopeptidase [Mycetohabitans sp. B2]MCG1046503.1 M48 family metallopeptidase [Mycetohabitans sp. B6]CBW74263.1 Zinc metalloprotease (EC 3.4.24.-) [Mycetohabitans rhizoxinica HKI 454]
MFTFLFVVALVAMIATRLWLASRQIRHVANHRHAVPDGFRDTISLQAHQRAADYTISLTRLAMLELGVGGALLVALTLLGGLQWLDTLLSGWLGRGYAGQIALVTTVAVIIGLVDLPFDYARHFVIEARFGFNRMSRKLFFADLVKGTLLGALIGLPLLFVVLWLMQQAGAMWWIWAWLVWVTFSVGVLVLYPSVIAPLFNKFEPLTDASLRERIESLMHRCGFAAKGLFVMDGSRRSAHGNAYFTGFGTAKRIVFFDTLLSRLDGSEIEAVLAHELGHFKHRHVLKRMIITFALSFVLLALLGWLAQRPWFYTSLGVTPSMTGSNDALALILFCLVMPVFLFFVTPLTSLSSRKHEFEADAFAATQARAQDLISALVKLYQDNASTLTPDPVYSAFYYSHPPAAQRIERLLAHART